MNTISLPFVVKNRRGYATLPSLARSAAMALAILSGARERLEPPILSEPVSYDEFQFQYFCLTARHLYAMRIFSARNVKSLLALLYLSTLATGVFAQGMITVANGTYAFARTNTTGFGGGVGNTAPTLGGFYYAVFTAASTVTSIDANLQNLLSGIWTFTGVYATNNSVATGGRLNGGANVATSQGWTPGQTNSYLLLGWSGNLATFDVNTVLNDLRGAQLQGGVWLGGGLNTNFFDVAYVGVSAIGFGEAGGGTTGLGSLQLFGTTATPAGQPIGSPFDLYPTCGPCPEPSAFATVALGAAVLLIVRRRR